MFRNTASPKKVQTARISSRLRVWIALSVFFICSYEAQESNSDQSGIKQQPESAFQTGIADNFKVALQPWKGDYDGMVERRMVRILVPYSKSHFFLDGAMKRGIVAALGRELEREINKREGLRTRLVHAVFVPVPRSQLIPWLMGGLGDIAAGSLTITESRQAVVDFSEPLLRNSKELVVTGPGSPTLNTIKDLAGQEVYVQASSSYFQSLKKLSQSFEDKGLSPIKIKKIDDLLEVDEILELIHAGLLPTTVVHQHLADVWGQVFTGLTIHSGLIVAAERDLGWAFRKDSPKLKEVLNEFISTRRHRTKFGNIIFRRYLQNLSWVKNVNTTAQRERYRQTKPLFKKYGEKYDLEPLFLSALGYQESRLDQSVRSPVGAIGVMQLLPKTGAWMDVGDIAQLEPNIHAGTRYFRLLMDTISSPELDRLNKTLFALASYNAGQTRIRRLRRETEQKGLDPNVWFYNVELAVAREIGRETVQYVRNIYKFYLAFRLIEQRRAKRAAGTVDP